MDGKVYLARRMNLLGEPHAKLITFVAEPDKRFPFSGSDPVIPFILLLNFSHRISGDTFNNFHLLTFIYTKSSLSRDQLP